jgi:hemoglobin
VNWTGAAGLPKGARTIADQTIFEQIGPEGFEQLLERFYGAVAADPLLRPIYPEDLAESQRRLRLFLIQYFGGPETYSTERGHPRLRMRHLPFAIDRAARDAWVGHMTRALESLDIPDPARDEMRRYFEDAATFLINRPA